MTPWRMKTAPAIDNNSNNNNNNNTDGQHCGYSFADCPVTTAPATEPFHRRKRFSTEETPPIHNLSPSSPSETATKKFLTMTTQDNPFQSYSDDESDSLVFNTNASDHHRNGFHCGDSHRSMSDVSSISNDSKKRYIKAPGLATAATAPEAAATATPENRYPPPQEINVPSTHTPRSVPDWLRSSPNEEEPSGTQPKLLPNRPSGIKRGLSVSSLPSRNNGGGSSSAAVLRGGREDTTSVVTNNSTCADVSLVGSRPRRVHHSRGHSLAFSIGSLVGQSSMKTEPTCTESSTTIHSATGVDCYYNTLSLMQHHHLHHRRVQSSCEVMLRPTPSKEMMMQDKPPRSRRKNPVKQEMLYVLGKVTKPVRGLVRSGSKSNLELRRSGGCLA